MLTTRNENLIMFNWFMAIEFMIAFPILSNTNLKPETAMHQVKFNKACPTRKKIDINKTR